MASDAPVWAAIGHRRHSARSRRALPSARLVTVAQKARGTIHLWFSRRQDNGQCAALFYKKSEYGLSDAFSGSWLAYADWGIGAVPRGNLRVGERQPRTPGWPIRPPGGHRRQADRSDQATFPAARASRTRSLWRASYQSASSTRFHNPSSS